MKTSVLNSTSNRRFGLLDGSGRETVKWPSYKIVYSNAMRQSKPSIAGRHLIPIHCHTYIFIHIYTQYFLDWLYLFFLQTIMVILYISLTQINFHCIQYISFIWRISIFFDIFLPFCLNISWTRRHTCVMVIIIGNWISDLSSNPGWGCLHFTLHSCPLGKIWNLLFSSLHLTMDK